MTLPPTYAAIVSAIADLSTFTALDLRTRLRVNNRRCNNILKVLCQSGHVRVCDAIAKPKVYERVTESTRVRAGWKRRTAAVRRYDAPVVVCDEVRPRFAGSDAMPIRERGVA